MKSMKEQIEELEHANREAYRTLKMQVESKFNGYGHIASYNDICNAGHERDILFRKNNNIK